jgi:hypothetical protein
VRNVYWMGIGEFQKPRKSVTATFAERHIPQKIDHGDHACFVDVNLTNPLRECSRLQPHSCSDTSKTGVHGDDGSTSHLEGPCSLRPSLYNTSRTHSYRTSTLACLAVIKFLDCRGVRKPWLRRYLDFYEISSKDKRLQMQDSSPREL